MNRSFINHLMLCRSCYAQSGRYCETGKAEKIESDAEYVCTLQKLDERRRVMVILKKQHPALYERLEARVKEIFKEMREAKNEACH